MSIITVENISKSYLIGHRARRATNSHTDLRDVIAREVRDAARKTMDMFRGRDLVHGDSVEEFWALRNVNFSVQEGEVLGIIGRNGAGKSTLLKILSRITEPSSGRVTLYGRVASLLEVGTGFHPELTGRENIYLNGAILGMTRAEIGKKFDEIVAFAEIERFLDTPVKRYSSGMYVRLAFAVAAHLEPEILVIDEVLAVGDSEFQKKCLGKMSSVASGGRTVLFVSHNHSAIQSLCHQCMLLRDGQVSKIGEPVEVLNEYLQYSSLSTVIIFHDDMRKTAPSSKIQLSRFEMGTLLPKIRQPFSATLRVKVDEPVSNVVFGVGFSALNGQRVLTCDSDFDEDRSFRFTTPGEYDLQIFIPALPLWPSRYVLDVGCRTRSGRMLDAISGVAAVEVLPDDEMPQVGLGSFQTACGRSLWRCSAEALQLA